MKKEMAVTKGNITGMITSLAVLALMLTARAAIAGTAGSEFTQLYDMLEGWTTGMLGKSIALASFLVGMGFSVVRQSLLPVAVGIGAAASLAYTPEILGSIITAVIF